MNNTKKQKNKKFSLPSFVVKAAFLFVVSSMLISFVSNEVEIAAKKEELAEIEAQVAAQIADNEELTLLMEASEAEIVERVAREEYDYAMPNERVFIDMSGK
ncbi:MAG: septum formation initiator family protein [Faecalibacterium sp.]